MDLVFSLYSVVFFYYQTRIVVCVTIFIKAARIFCVYELVRTSLFYRALLHFTASSFPLRLSMFQAMIE